MLLNFNEFFKMFLFGWNDLSKKYENRGSSFHIRSSVGGGTMEKELNFNNQCQLLCLLLIKCTSD